jgi:DNA-binding GntR family transcriptional regulator
MFRESTIPFVASPSTEPRTLAARAYDEIRSRVLRGAIRVGESLSRRMLAAELGISVPPVTEALLQLEAEGLVESRSRAGTRVRVPTREEVENRTVLREALECRSARLFCERATAAERKELQRSSRQVDQFYAACETDPGDQSLLFAANRVHMELHLRIAECTRCGPLHDAIEKEQVLVFSWLYDTAVDRKAVGSDCHERLLDVMTTGTPSQAEAAMQRHIREGLRQVLARLDTFRPPACGWRAQRRIGAD